MRRRIKIEKTCEHCGKVFNPWHLFNKYCSIFCANMVINGCLAAPACQSTHKERIQCAYCGKYKLVDISERRRYCSPDCAWKKRHDVPKGKGLEGYRTKRKAADAVECPLCHKRLLKVNNSHTMFVHGVDAKTLGIKRIAPSVVQTYSELFKKTNVRVNKRHVAIPSVLWPVDSRFARLVVEGDVLILSPATKAVDRTYRSLIRQCATLNLSLGIGRAGTSELGELLQANVTSIEQDKTYRIIIHLRPEVMPFVKLWVERKPLPSEILNYIPGRKEITSENR